MQNTSSKKTAGIVSGLVILLGLAYPAVTFAATGGTSTPPSTINTCTKVNAKTHLYGKTKVSASTACPAGQYAQNWISDQAYTWSSDPLGQQFPVIGSMTFPAGDTVSFVSGTIPANFNDCINNGGNNGPIVQLTVGQGGPALAQWTFLIGEVSPPTPIERPVTLSSPSDIVMADTCPGTNSNRFGDTFSVTVSVTPPFPSIPSSPYN
jgi:hypothetical protein